jgi:hypothetical protein
MTDTPEFDAAILHVVNQQRLEAGQKPISELGYIGETRKFVGGIIAKLLEGMEPPAWFSVEEDSGFDFALTEIRRRAGIEGGES